MARTKLKKKFKRIRRMGVCTYCGHKSKRLSVEHIVPQSVKKSHINLNLIPVCHFCNSHRDSKPLGHWLKNNNRQTVHDMLVNRLYHAEQQYMHWLSMGKNPKIDFVDSMGKFIIEFRKQVNSFGV